MASEALLAFLTEKFDADFIQKFKNDSNAVILKRQMHFISHNATCYKFGAAATQKCRFDFPQLCVNQTAII